MNVSIIGLGPSWKLYESGFSIGVNDVWRNVKTDVIVCLDYESVFTPDRLRVIKESTPQAFYSQIINWDHRKDFRKVDIIPGYHTFIDLKRPGYYKSYCSPFVACQIAYKEYGADEIHLYGVDLTNHPHLDGKLCSKIVEHFAGLQKALNEAGAKIVVHGEGILKNI